jgi:GNAT superfamily N-acetyltransferase
VGGVPDRLAVDVTIRPARFDEGERLREIAIAAKSHWGYELTRVRDWAAQSDFSPAGLTAKTFVVAEAGGRAIGFASLLEHGETWILDDLWIEPEWIGRGIGSRLFAGCVERARESGVKRLEWEAEPNAVGFYEKVGGRYVRESEPTAFGRTVPVMELHLTT